ncbi:hypothetical protein BO79DRAFT_220807 [Aspergillus costaricaensis CBS 115574]|uniref:Uncharacterized protein n=1 Tax=Aspergillus costaricaensis CBS 115574 TaxID=1448317 RepID=A0ACD1I4E3_9EURO|nr:hypothetical protein BO79DRAFT_220807 [Aspergillus costaricaensis CBS 115574]RAK85370.1 hypothetical protein BO79DRAFT_220807 [Aspergillus costaricaensis CBS 115574]
MQQGPPPQTLRYYQSPPIRRYISQILSNRPASASEAGRPCLAEYPAALLPNLSLHCRESKADVSMVNSRNNGFHEVIVVEAKKPTGRAPTQHKWNGARQQLQKDNMLAFRNRLGNVQTMTTGLVPSACHICVISPQFGWPGLGHPLFGLSGSRKSKYLVGAMGYGVRL